MDRRSAGGEAGRGGPRRCAEGRDGVVQADELHQAEQRQEIQADGDSLHADGEHSVLPGSCSELRGPCGGTVPDSGPLREEKHSSGLIQVMSSSWSSVFEQVVLSLFSLGRLTQHHDDYCGPAIGPKMSTKNERNFSEEQIRMNRDAVIGLQAGTNVGATQV